MAEKRYNFKISPEYPSSEQIAQHQDFDALLQAYEGSQVKTGGRVRAMQAMYWLAAACAAALIGLVLYQSFFTTVSTAADDYFAAQPYVNPPLEIPANFASQAFNAEQGGVFEYESGSRVIIPPAAFVTGQGAPVNGEVDIRYREFHDYVDFFASGIPMEYDSAGQRYLLESAGMVEIYAEQSGERLNMAPGKTIKVELISEIIVPASQKGQLSGFNVYQLDKNQRNWVYKDLDQIDLLDEGELLPSAKEQIELDYKNALQRIAEDESNALAKIEASVSKPIAPIRPEQPNGDDFVFDLDFTDGQIEDDQSRKELQALREQYGHMLWQVGPNNPGFNQQRASSVNWEDMKLRKVNEEDYELQLFAGNTSMKIIVRPVLTGNDYQRALEIYQAQLSDYQQQMAEREGQLRDQKIDLDTKIAQQKETARADYKAQLAALKDSDARSDKVRHRIRNRFVATSFGIWNCDRPIKPFAVAVSGEFKDDNSHEYEANTAYLVNKEKNTICRFYTGKGGSVKFDQKGKHMLWVVTPENKIAVLRPEELRINKSKDDYTFNMKVIDKKIETEADLRRVLTF